MVFIYLIVGIVAGLIGVSMASGRGQNQAVWFIVCFLFPIALIGLLFVPKIKSASASNNYSRTQSETGFLLQTAPDMRSLPPIDPEFNAKWTILTKYDSEIADAVHRLEPYGENAVIKFKHIYGVFQDKSKIHGIVQDIVGEIDEYNRRMQSLSIIIFPSSIPVYIEDELKKNGFVRSTEGWVGDIGASSINKGQLEELIVPYQGVVRRYGAAVIANQ